MSTAAIAEIETVEQAEAEARRFERIARTQPFGSDARNEALASARELWALANTLD